MQINPPSYVSFFLWRESKRRAHGCLKRRFKNLYQHTQGHKRKRKLSRKYTGQLRMLRQIHQRQRKRQRNRQLKALLRPYIKRSTRRLGTRMDGLGYGFKAAYLPRDVVFYFNAAYPPDPFWTPYYIPAKGFYPDASHGNGPSSDAPDKKLRQRVNKRLVPSVNAPKLEPLGAVRLKHTFICLAFAPQVRPTIKLHAPMSRTFALRPELLGEVPHIIASPCLYLNPMIIPAFSPNGLQHRDLKQGFHTTHGKKTRPPMRVVQGQSHVHLKPRRLQKSLKDKAKSDPTLKRHSAQQAQRERQIDAWRKPLPNLPTKLGFQAKKSFASGHPWLNGLLH